MSRLRRWILSRCQDFLDNCILFIVLVIGIVVLVLTWRSSRFDV